MTFGIVSAATVDVCGIITLTIEVSMLGIVSAGEVGEIAERIVEPETSLT